MASKKLTDTNISDTYRGVLHLRGSGLRTDGVTEAVYDGLGTKTPLNLSIEEIEVRGDGNFRDPDNNNTGVYIKSSIGGIEMVDGADDNPYIDFKSSTTENYDCRIIKSDDGLLIQTGGNASKRTAAKFTKNQDLEVYGRVIVGLTGLGGPYTSIDASRDEETTIDTLQLYSNDEIKLYTESVEEGNVMLTATRTGIGIGTTNPQKKLHIDGQMRYEYGTPQVGQVLTCTSTTGNVAWRGGGNLYFVNLTGTSFLTTARNANGVVYPTENVKARAMAIYPSLDSGDRVIVTWSYLNAAGANGTFYKRVNSTAAYKVNSADSWSVVSHNKGTKFS